MFSSLNYAFVSGSVGKALRFSGVLPLCSFFYLDIFLPRCLTNSLNNFDRTYREYSLVATGDLIRC